MYVKPPVGTAYQAIPTNNDAPGTNISNDNTANSALFSSTGCSIRSALKQKSSSACTVSGGENNVGAGGGAALSMCTGSEASPAPTKDNQPGRTSGGGKTVEFSPIIQLFEKSGEEFFEKDCLKHIQKDSEQGFQQRLGGAERSGTGSEPEQSMPLWALL